MSKTKKTTEPHYELLYLISNKFTEDEVKTVAEKVEAIITANGAEITYRENWGKKKLAYPVKHFAYGYYLYVEFDIEGVKLAKLERAIRLAHDVLRHQIIVRSVRTIDMKEKPKQLFFDEPKKDKVAPRAEGAAPEAKEEAALVAVEKTEEPKAVATKKEKEEVKAPKKAAKAPKETKASLEELDAKLDKILETNDLL